MQSIAIRLRAIALLFLVLFATPLHAQAPNPNLSASVVLDGRELFRVYANRSSFQPAERAQIISGRLQTIAESPEYSSEELTVTHGSKSSEIRLGDVSLVTITDSDATIAGKDRRDLAEADAQAIRLALERYRQEHSVHSLLTSLLYTLIATLLLAIAMFLLHRLTVVLTRRIVTARPSASKITAISGIDDFFNAHFAQPLIRLINIVKFIFYVALGYAYLLFVSGLFPETRSYAVQLQEELTKDFFTIGSAFLTKLPDMIVVGVLILLANFILRVARLFFNGIETGAITFTHLDPELAPPTYRLFRILFFLLTAIAIFPYIPGSESPAFRGISVFLGALVTLGSSSVTSNLIGGIILTYTRPFRIGDRVKIGETVGDVIAKSDLATRIRTSKNEEITLPNALILSLPIQNYSSIASSSGEGVILHTTVTIGYDVPWDRVHELLIAAASATEGMRSDPPPFVLQTALKDFSVAYELNAYTDYPNQMSSLYSLLHQNIQDRFNEAGIEIMSPYYAAIRDGGQTTLPDSYRTK